MLRAPFSRPAINMSRLSVVIFLAAVFSSSPLESQRRVPRFEDYPVATTYRGESRPPNVSGMDEFEVHSCFGDDPAAYANKQPNFAGHYIVQSCSCGTGCHSVVLWDAATGRTIGGGLPFGAINVGPFSGNGNEAQILYGGEQYGHESTLMIVDGCLSESCDCATRYYNFARGQFRLILTQSVRLPRGCSTRGPALRP